MSALFDEKNGLWILTCSCTVLAERAAIPLWNFRVHREKAPTRFYAFYSSRLTVLIIDGNAVSCSGNTSVIYAEKKTYLLMYSIFNTRSRRITQLGSTQLSICVNLALSLGPTSGRKRRIGFKGCLYCLIRRIVISSL